MHGMGTKGDPTTLLHLMYLMPCKRAIPLLFWQHRCRNSEPRAHLLQKSLSFGYRWRVAQTLIYLIGQLLGIVVVFQYIMFAIEFDRSHRRTPHQTVSLPPPEIVAALRIARHQEDGNRHAQFLSNRKGMGVIIVVTIIKCQDERGTSIGFALPPWSVEFLQRLFERQHAVMTAQIVHMAIEIAAARAMIVKNNQLRPLVSHNPARQRYQPAIVETGSHNDT